MPIRSDPPERIVSHRALVKTTIVARELYELQQVVSRGVPRVPAQDSDAAVRQGQQIKSRTRIPERSSSMIRERTDTLGRIAKHFRARTDIHDGTTVSLVSR